MIRSINTCTNCENLANNFRCTKHNEYVDFNNVCDSHTQNSFLNKDSSCISCAFYNHSDCQYPDRAGVGMLCFNWSQKLD